MSFIQLLKKLFLPYVSDYELFIQDMKDHEGTNKK